MFPSELRSERERVLRGIGIAISIVAWLLLAVSLVGAIYGLFIAAFIAIAHALYLAHVRGNGVRLGPTQLPHLWDKVTAAAQRFGLREPPAAYLLQSGGVLNAFATKLLGRRFIVLYASLVDACERDAAAGGPSEIDFVIAHEVAHLAAGHLSWFLLPIRVFPLLGPAYSRACEYTCDRAGQAFVGDLERSSRALAILAAGARAGRAIDLDVFVEQRRESGSFWMAVYELNATHPYLPKRIAALREWAQPGTAPAVGRNIAAYPLAPMFGAAVGGAASAPLVMVMIIAALAAIAIPSFQRYVARAQALQAPAAGAGATSPEAAGDPRAADAPGTVRGSRFDWTLTLPGPKWELIPDAQARQQNRMADRWITRPDLDAHVMVIAENLGGQALSLDDFAKTVLGNARGHAKQFRVLGDQAIPGGRLIEARSVVDKGFALTQFWGLFLSNGNAYQVYGFAPQSSYDRAKPELVAAIQSFAPPR